MSYGVPPISSTTLPHVLKKGINRMPSDYVRERLAAIRAENEARRLHVEPPRRSRQHQTVVGADAVGAGWVYFAGADGQNAVKIGFTTNLATRLSELQTGSAAKLSYHGYFPATRDAETMIHRHFRGIRISREWFHFTSEIEDLLDDVFDYQGSRCAAAVASNTDATAKDLLNLMDEAPIPLVDLRYILATIGKPWASDFVPAPVTIIAAPA